MLQPNIVSIAPNFRNKFGIHLVLPGKVDVGGSEWYETRIVADPVVTNKSKEIKRRLTALRKLTREARMSGLQGSMGRAMKEVERELGAIRDAIPNCRCGRQ